MIYLSPTIVCDLPSLRGVVMILLSTRSYVDWIFVEEASDVTDDTYDDDGDDDDNDDVILDSADNWFIAP